MILNNLGNLHCRHITRIGGDIIIDLKRKSIDIIISNQHPSGSYTASPNFETYRYCWLRDGSFIAYSMDLSGRYDSAGKFFDWADMVISRQSERVGRIIEATGRGEPLLNSDYLPARYHLDGRETWDEWPNFQLDGYGTWLWALCEHIRNCNETNLIEKYYISIKTGVDYLVNFWDTPSFDCWEENGERIHPSTLACIYGGLNTISAYYTDGRIRTVLCKIRDYILQNCVKNGRLVKYAGSDSIDASLLWVAVPFGLLDALHEIIINTVAEIENRLLHNGGVHRYPEDTYYGGGEWLILTCWLGWYYTQTGAADKAKAMLGWAEKQANFKGELPEQVLNHVNNPDYIEKWKDLWGESAVPLLWSHAMYLVLYDKLSGL